MMRAILRYDRAYRFAYTRTLNCPPGMPTNIGIGGTGLALSRALHTHNAGDDGMTKLSKEDLMLLAERRPGWHVSMFLPMHRGGVETLQNPVRCKNLLRQAEEHLLAGGLRPSQAQEFLAPVQQLLGDYD